MLLPLPNMVIASPKNLIEVNKLLRFAINYHAPFAIRYPKGDVVDKIDEDNDLPLTLGQWIIEKPLTKVNILTYSDNVYDFLDNLNEENIGLIHALFIKPIDIDLLKSLKNTTLYIVEEVISIGSLASLVFEINSKENLNIKIHTFSIENSFPDIGTREQLRKQYKIDALSVIQTIKSKEETC